LVKFSKGWLVSNVTTQGVVLGRGTGGSAVASSEDPTWNWLAPPEALLVCEWSG
jgi:hypothetical protein